MSNASTAGGGEFTWGVVGTNRWEMLRLDRNIDRDGVVREVEPGVEYAPEAREAAGVELPFPRWRKRPDGRYEMDLGDSELPRARTLLEVRQGLQSRRWRGGEPPLRELDHVATALLRAVARLHDAGFGVGLLQPANVVLLPGEAGEPPSVVLPDFGFVRFRGVLPEWMRPDLPFRLLWDKPPEWMNERCFDRVRYPKLAAKYADTADKVQGPGFDRQSDLRTVARLLAWLLSPDGRPRREIPSREAAAWSKAEVWEVLREATGGAYADADVFADALEDETTRPSRHFVEQIKPPPPPPPPWWRWAVPAGASLALLAGVGFLAYTWRPPATQRHPLCPECASSSKLVPLLDEYLRAKKDPEQEYAALKKMFDPAVLSERESYRDAEKACLDRLSRRTLEGLADKEKEFKERGFNGGMSMPEYNAGLKSIRGMTESLDSLRAGQAPRS